MAVGTLDQLVAALAAGERRCFFKLVAGSSTGQHFSLWKQAGNPGPAATPPNAAAGGEIPTRATSGALPFTNPAAGQKAYLGALQIASTTAGGFIVTLYDRLYHVSGLSAGSTAAQVITSPPSVSRGSAVGVEAFIEHYALTGVTSAATVVVSYVNQDGVAATSPAFGFPSTAAYAAVAAMRPVPLAAGDTGIQAVTGVQLSANTGAAGDFGLTLARRLAEIQISASANGDFKDAFRSNMPQIPNDACLALMYRCISASLVGELHGRIKIAKG